MIDLETPVEFATSRVRVVIVDDHPLFRQATIAALSLDPHIKVIGEGSSAADALDLVEHLQPDLILLDIGMPGGGLEAAAGIARGYPNIKIVMLTFSEEEDDVHKALSFGVQGYVLKGVSGRALRGIIQNIWNGETYFALAFG